MTHEHAFLDAIHAAPRDDAPRLIFADWLEERGSPMGEFIRWQVLTRFGIGLNITPLETQRAGMSVPRERRGRPWVVFDGGRFRNLILPIIHEWLRPYPYEADAVYLNGEMSRGLPVICHRHVIENISALDALRLPPHVRVERLSVDLSRLPVEAFLRHPALSRADGLSVMGEGLAEFLARLADTEWPERMEGLMAWFRTSSEAAEIERAMKVLSGRMKVERHHLYSPHD